MSHKVGVLMTSHNRCAQTLACLASVFDQEGSWEPIIILVDDGSVDSTARHVSAVHPQVKVVQGSGDLYWAGGMRLAYEMLMNIKTDYVLWLNDDVRLDRGAFSSLARVEDEKSSARSRVIVVGALRDPETGITTYGGLKRSHGLLSPEFVRLAASNSPEQCDTMNGNVVFMARTLASHLGNLDPTFQHALADWDYGLRARRRGVAIWMTPTHVGTCAIGPPPIWTNTDADPTDRWQNLFSPKGLRPQEWWVFSRRHLGTLWPLRWLSPYAKVAVSIMQLLIRRGLRLLRWER